MIISKTPLRISFFSGGSDLPSFYEKEDGAALSVTIDKFIHVCSHQTPYHQIRTMYDSVEEADALDNMEAGITKETLSYFNIHSNITIASISDILVRGSGLGSSSAFTVGLIKNILAHNKSDISRINLAEHAFNIEANMCGYPVGKQDQYAAAFGGFNLFEFKQQGYVTVKNIAQNFDKLEENLLLVYSGKGRSANHILAKQKSASSDKEKFKLIQASRDKAYTAFSLLEKNDFDSFGDLLHQAWLDKKSVVKEISNDYLNEIYNRAIKAGALGGKILGAGGGGFFIFYVKPDRREEVINSICKDTLCKIYDFKFYEHGARINEIY